MALPTPELTWAYNVNQTFTASVDAYSTVREVLFNIKQSLTSSAGGVSSPWVVVSSSNATVASAGDNWSTSADVVSAYNGQNHSWVVLQQSALGNYQILIDYYSDAGNGARYNFWISNAAGFTGGSTTSRPTATDEYQRINNLAFIYDSSSPVQCALHVLRSVDGYNTGIFITSTGFNQTAWLINKPADNPVAWSPAVVATIASTNGNSDALTHSNFNQNAYSRARINGNNVGIYLTGEGFGDGTVAENFNIPNQLDDSYAILPMGVACNESPVRGRHGRLRDIWWGQSSAPPAYTGATYPSDGSKQFIQFGHMIFPWNGSAPIVG